MLTWEPVRGARAPGRPAARWEDALVNFMKAKGRWVDVAKDRETWGALESEFAEKGLDRRLE